MPSKNVNTWMKSTDLSDNKIEVLNIKKYSKEMKEDYGICYSKPFYTASFCLINPTIG